MDSVFTPNKTSARLLIDYAEQSGFDEKRRLILYDLYIKARSYAIINKTAFWLAVLGGAMVLVWPSIAIILKDYGIEKTFWQSAVVQTTVTGLAALVFAVYSHYKKRQMSVENLMRYVMYSEIPISELALKIVGELEKLDAGFSFSEAVGRGAKKEEEKKQ